MGIDVTHEGTETLAERLAAAAGVKELAAGAAVDAAEGDELLRQLLTDQMATAHLLTMRMAAKADGAIAATGSADAARLPPLDQAAARFAGAAARLTGRYRQGLLALHRLPPSQPAEPQLCGYSFDGDPPLPPAEQARRINRARFYHALNRRDETPSAAKARPRLGDAAAELIGPAQAAAAELVEQTGIGGLFAAGASPLTLFTHQLAATHRVTMGLGGRADALLAASDGPLGDPQALRLAHGAARLMGHYRQGLLALDRLRREPAAPGSPGGPGETITFWSGPLKDYDREQQRKVDLDHGLDPDTGLPQQQPAAVLRNRGRLNNGNPGGDFLAAPRCGATTRAGCSCRQPAMPNGRCRFHGGKSTGPRTAEGLARSRAARRVHGLRSAEVIALSSAAAATHRRLGDLLRALRPAGHGVDRSNLTATILPFKKIHHEATKDTKTRPLSLRTLRGFVVK